MTHKSHHAVLSIVVATCLMVTPALSSGGTFCESKDGKAEFHVKTSRLPVFAPMGAAARLGELNWSTEPGTAIQLGASQGMIEEGSLVVDYTDGDFQNIIISLRVDTAAEETDDGFPGVLKFHNMETFDVWCVFE